MQFGVLCFLQKKKKITKLTILRNLRWIFLISQHSILINNDVWCGSCLLVNRQFLQRTFPFDTYNINSLHLIASWIIKRRDWVFDKFILLFVFYVSRRNSFLHACESIFWLKVDDVIIRKELINYKLNNVNT
jgi:hypothetical protein